jgi:hypothetical protein
MALQIRRGTDAERTAGGGVVFAEGELIYVTDTDALYIGDGSTAGGVKLTDNAGATLGTYITADTINSTIDLQQDLDLNGNDIIGTGNININGTITATGNINIGDDADADTVDFTAKITSTLTPNADSTYDLGTTALRWANAFVDDITVTDTITASSITADVVADNASVMVDVSANTFTGDLTGDVTGNVNGNLTGNVTGNVDGDTTGYHTGDVKGSVFGNDSTPIVDAVNNTLNGNLTGDVTGNVTGNVTGDVAGILTGSIKGSGGNTVLSANTGPTDAEISVLNISATGTITGNVSGNLTGNVTGNTTGYHTGDVKGSVFADGSTLLVDAVAGTIPGENITGTVTATFAGNLTGDVTGNLTGNVFTSTIDSSDSSSITVTPQMNFSSDVIVNQGIEINPTGNIGGATIQLSNNGHINSLRLETQFIKHTNAGEVKFEDRTGFLQRSTFEERLVALKEVEGFRIDGEYEPSFVLHTFSGDPEDDDDIANPANYDTHFEATHEKATFGVPVKFAVYADASARNTAIPSPEVGMVVIVGTTMQLNTDGTTGGWVSVTTS